MSGRRLFAAIALVILAVADMAPHRHGDEPFGFAGLLAAAEIHDTRCATPNSVDGHLHRDSPRRIDPCVACVRQHLQATAPIDIQRDPQIVERSFTAARAPMMAKASTRTASSRAPPTLL